MIPKDLIILPKAEQDVTDSYIWHEAQEVGLGEEFLHCVDACIQSIRQNPQIYQVVHESYRRAVIRRFPYVIFYEYLDNTIIIYSVFHCSQNPQKWRNQLP